MKKTLIFSLFILARLAISETCSSDCVQINTKRDSMAAHIAKLESLRRENFDFVATLGDDEISKRLKATSNMLILDRMLKEEKPKFKDAETEYQDKHCALCEGK